VQQRKRLGVANACITGIIASVGDVVSSHDDHALSIICQEIDVVCTNVLYVQVKSCVGIPTGIPSAKDPKCETASTCARLWKQNNIMRTSREWLAFMLKNILV
jgi:hypothetical protein